MTTVKTCCAALAAGATLLAVAAPSPAAKHKPAAKAAATIDIKLKGKGKKALPIFVGPKTVKQGAKLTIVNQTKVQAIGPHTFSLVNPGLVPRSIKAQKKCAAEKGLTGLCLKLAKAHKVNLKSGKVGKVSLDAGKKGWDTEFGKTGDSYVSQDKGDNTSRVVSAKAGTTLTYFCAVHPNMVGKIKVVG